jgi:hypothetical protein
MTYSLPTDFTKLTDYTPACAIDAKIMKDNNITDPNEYRMFLQRNATKIMEIQRKNIQKK